MRSQIHWIFADILYYNLRKSALICVSDFHYKKLHYVFIIISFAFAGGGSGNKIGYWLMLSNCSTSY